VESHAKDLAKIHADMTGDVCGEGSRALVSIGEDSNRGGIPAGRMSPMRSTVRESHVDRKI